MRFFHQPESIIILADIYSSRGLELVKAEIDRKLATHRPVRLMELPARGHFALVFTHARQGIAAAVPIRVNGVDVSMSIVVTPFDTGVGRLSISDEIRVYRESYQAGTLLESVSNLSTDAAEARLGELRRELGPLRVDKLPPGLFALTWKEVSRLSADIDILCRLLPSETYAPSEQFDDIFRLGGKRAVASIGLTLQERTLPTLTIADCHLGFENGRRVRYQEITQHLELHETTQNTH